MLLSGVYVLVWKPYLFPPPFMKIIFFPLPRMLFFDSHRGLLAVIFPYLLLFYLFTSLFLIFFPHSSFFFSLFLFFHIFPLFLFAFSYFFPQMSSADISPPQGGIFQYIYPWLLCQFINISCPTTAAFLIWRFWWCYMCYATCPLCDDCFAHTYLTRVVIYCVLHTAWELCIIFMGTLH